LKGLSEGHHQIPFCYKKFQYPEEKRWFRFSARVKRIEAYISVD